MNKEITAQVHMLPTKLSTKYGDMLKALKDVELTTCKKGDIIFNPFTYTGKNDAEYWETQHLYFTTDEPIQKGDWYHDNFMRRVEMCDDEDYSNQIKEEDYDFSKIIASTDPTLCLPTIPTTWIKDVYVPSNGSIKKVELKMVEIDESSFTPHCFVLKLTPNNEVVIVDEPTLETLFPKEQCGDLSVDQELEDAAKDHIDAKMGGSKYRLESPNDAYITARMQSFKEGANWRAEQSANDAIQFAEWLDIATKQSENRCFIERTEGYTYPNLYKLWLKTKNNADN